MMSRPGTTSPVEQAIHALKQRLGPRANDTQAIREHHSHDESSHTAAAPDVVCLPHNTDEVSDILKISARFQLPVVPFGAGTSLEGHVNAVHDGITIDLREMSRIVRVRVDDLDATVEAGVTCLHLHKALKNTGLMFPITIKRALDPDNRMNPGKMISEAHS